MGKFMKKSKITGDFAVMDVSPQYSLGVRTRAKTLALQRLQSPPPEAGIDDSPFSYLQLRSRRLEKLPPAIHGLNRKLHRESAAGESRKAVGSGESVEIGEIGGEEKSETGDLDVEASLGENNLDFEPRERSTRESTPCSFIRDPSTVGTPGSTTRRSDSRAANRRPRSDVQRDIPTSHEIEDFFACAEQHQQRLFTEKYNNFDVVNDSPLSGRYDWVQLTP